MIKPIKPVQFIVVNTDRACKRSEKRSGVDRAENQVQRSGAVIGHKRFYRAAWNADAVLR